MISNYEQNNLIGEPALDVLSEKSIFFEVVVKFQKAGYQTKVSRDSINDYWFCLVEGNGIIGGFCEANQSSYHNINGRVAFDNEEVFDKWSKCPYSYPLPQSDSQFEYILSKMKYLATEEGCEASNQYKLKFETDYPEELVV